MLTEVSFQNDGANLKVNVRGFGALTVASVAVVEQAQQAEQPPADRDRIPFIARSAARNGRKSLTESAQPGGKSLAVELP